MIEQLIGRFHPLIVHLPIGFLAMAILLKFIGDYKYKEEIKKLLPLVTKLSFAACLLAMLSGYVLHLNEAYEDELVHNHMYFGIGLTAITGLLMLNIQVKWFDYFLWVIAAILLFITGHFGGSLTHGENYLTAVKEEENVSKSIKIDTANALIYQDIVKPILDEKCTTCHSSKKQKGGLRLDNLEFISKGGEHGKPFVLNKPEESLIFKRIMLDLKEEKHMPPKGKPQLTSDEKKIITWWLENNPASDQKISGLSKSVAIKDILKQLSSDSKEEVEVPLPTIEIVDPKIITEAKNIGIVLSSISQNENYLSVNLSFKKEFTMKQKLVLAKLKDHIVWLRASDIKNADSLLTIIPTFTNLKKLYLDNSDASDGYIQNLNNLKRLQLVNLTNTAITTDGLKKVSGLRTLRQIFLFGSKVDKKQWKDLQRLFPNAIIDSGGYIVPTFVEDTSRIKT